MLLCFAEKEMQNSTKTQKLRTYSTMIYSCPVIWGKIFLFAFIEGAGFVIDVCQSMKFQSDREYLGQNYKDTGYLKKNSMEWEIF